MKDPLKRLYKICLYLINRNIYQNIILEKFAARKNNRFGEHLRNIERKIHEREEHTDDADRNVSKHFNLPDHSKADMSILGLKMAPICNKQRKTLEKRLIFKLGTLFPNGLNKQFSFS